MSRSLWLVASLAAAATLLWMALVGERPATHVAGFEAAGVMRQIALHEIHEIEVTSGARSWRFTRDPAGWVGVGPPTAGSIKVGSVDRGLRLLRDSAPERVLVGTGSRELAAYGLEPALLQVVVKGRGTFSVAFGTANPLGLARYARLAGSTDVLLLPRYVADTWEESVGLRSN